MSPTHREGSGLVIKGWLYALLAVALWSANFVIANKASATIAPVELAFYRWLVAFICLLPFARPTFARIQDVLKDKREVRRLALTAFTGVSAMNTLIYLAGKSAPAVDLSLISVASPAFIVAINRLVFRRRVRSATWLGVGMAMMGCVWLIGTDGTSSLAGLKVSTGDLLMVVASITFAVYTVVQRAPKGMADGEYLLLLIFTGLVGLLPFYLVREALYGCSPITLDTGVYILYLGVFASLVAFYLWNKSVKLIGASRTGVSYYALPCFVYLIEYVAGGKVLSGAVVGSFALIVAGAIVIHFTTTEATEGATATSGTGTNET